MKTVTPGIFEKLPYSGSGLANGSAVSVDSSGNAIASSNLANPYHPCIGFARIVESSYVIVQSSGKLNKSSTPGSEYWISTSGTITDQVPQTGTLQKVGIGLTNNQILIKIDTDIIQL